MLLSGFVNESAALTSVSVPGTDASKKDADKVKSR